jgi:hypothetical protein
MEIFSRLVPESVGLRKGNDFRHNLGGSVAYPKLGQPSAARLEPPQREGRSGSIASRFIMGSQERQNDVLIARCDKKIQLVIEYAATMARYYHAVAELERGMVSGSKELFIERHRLAEQARIMCEDARQELDGHVKADGC